MRSALLAALLLASGPALAGAEGLMLACKGKIMTYPKSGNTPLVTESMGSIVIDGTRVHISFLTEPCPIRHVGRTGLEFTCPAHGTYGDAGSILGGLDRFSG